MPDCTTIDARLARARQTYDDWMNGEKVSRFVDQNGESVSYSVGGQSRLESYIAKLEAEKSECSAGGPTGLSYRGPLRFTFGRRCY